MIAGRYIYYASVARQRGVIDDGAAAALMSLSNARWDEAVARSPANLPC